MQINILIFLVVFSIPLFSQVHESRIITHGNLIHINVDQNEIDVSDTLGYWQDVRDYIEVTTSRRSNYENVIRFNDQYYFTKKTRISNFDESYYYEIESINGHKLLLGWGWDVTPPAVSNFRYFTTEYGMFFYHDLIYFIDTLFQKHSSFINDDYYVYDLIGQIDSSYFCIIAVGDTAGAGIVDLSKLPEIETSNIQWLTYENYIHFFQQIDSNLFLLKSDQMYLSKIQGDSIVNLKNFEMEGNPTLFKYPYLYTSALIDRIIKYEYNNIDSSLTINKDIQLNFPGNVYRAIDPNLNYSTYIKNDTLFIFNINDEKMEKSWQISSLENHKPILIDDNNIYLHQRAYVTSISVPLYQPDAFHLNTYPNPFNSNITMEFDGQIPNSFELSIYNIQGQQVFFKRFNGRSHSNKFNWNPLNQSSSVYFVVVKTNFGDITKKIVYIK